MKKNRGMNKQMNGIMIKWKNEQVTRGYNIVVNGWAGASNPDLATPIHTKGRRKKVDE